MLIQVSRRRRYGLAETFVRGALGWINLVGITVLRLFYHARGDSCKKKRGAFGAALREIASTKKPCYY